MRLCVRRATSPCNAHVPHTSAGTTRMRPAFTSPLLLIVCSHVHGGFNVASGGPVRVHAPALCGAIDATCAVTSHARYGHRWHAVWCGVGHHCPFPSHCASLGCHRTAPCWADILARTRSPAAPMTRVTFASVSSGSERSLVAKHGPSKPGTRFTLGHVPRIYINASTHKEGEDESQGGLQ